MFTQKDQDRFLKKVIKADDPSDCWLWMGARHGQGRGYGKFWLGHSTISAHKAAYLLFVGPVPKGMVVAHQCNNERCCNPAHLKIETQLENMKFMVACGRHNFFGRHARQERGRTITEVVAAANFSLEWAAA